MLFSGLFTAYTVYRVLYPAAIADASSHLEVDLAGVMTAILIVGSLTVALALEAARADHQGRLQLYLAATIVLGIAFLGLKGVEYVNHYQEHMAPALDFNYPGANPGVAQLFFLLYFGMTGLHAIHLTVALIGLVAILVLAHRGHYGPAHYTPVELIGLYWHFVDVVWLFLLALLYFPGIAGTFP
jgi:cytochrome c oxidase subunit 3